MEILKSFGQFYQGKRVLVTGHTGFKGSWLALWLHHLGADVHGLSLSVPTVPSHFDLLSLEGKIKSHTFADICDFEALQKCFSKVQPEIVFHLAAEPIVKTCLDDPKLAFETNLGGSVNIFECIRKTKGVRAAVIITSDKCYENVEWDYGYRENDRLGGKDPYSASKACVEIAFSAYYRSYFSKNKELGIATTRAGNVIGGGDWAKDRIIPDCVRSISNKKVLVIRSPKATRPWQHVLEPLSGYLALAVRLYKDPQSGTPSLNGEAFNFGPGSDLEVNVESLLAAMKAKWELVEWKVETDPLASQEAGLLKLNCDKALRRLQWRPTLNFVETMELTSTWYKQWLSGTSIDTLSVEQIETYTRLAQERNLGWTK